MNNRKVLTDYVYKIVSSLLQSGVKNIVISPGSRSTPLAYAFKSVENLNVYRQVDERSAAFFALGLAKAKGKPVVLLCTSGTAAANYFPAIVEAKHARVPLIVITADRPHELREVGAPQAIKQIGLYGEQVKWSVEFPIPDDFKQTNPFIERHIARAVAIAMTAPFGPVHINVPFREPLLIDFQEQLPKPSFQHSYLGELLPSNVAQKEMSTIINNTRKGIVIIGELPLNTNVQFLWAFIRKIKWPVIVEGLSNMRSEVPEDCLKYVISTYDALLRSSAFKKKVVAETVIRFGAQPVSKSLTIFLREFVPKQYVVVDEDPMFRDSISISTHFIHASIGSWMEKISVKSPINEQYVSYWQEGEKVAKTFIRQYSQHERDEGAIVQTIVEHLPNRSDMFVSSSMPIRDIDTFLLPTNKDLKIYANRGANGIDGVMSTAIGFSQGREERHMYLLIGDLAFLHDSNALIATRYQPCHITVFLLNNDGGGIFSYLSQATVEDYFEDLFGTPTELQFKELAKMYDMEYVQVKQIEQLSQILDNKQEKPLRLIEIVTNRNENVKSHRKLWKQIDMGLQ